MTVTSFGQSNGFTFDCLDGGGNSVAIVTFSGSSGGQINGYPYWTGGVDNVSSDAYLLFVQNVNGIDRWEVHKAISGVDFPTDFNFGILFFYSNVIPGTLVCDNDDSTWANAVGCASVSVECLGVTDPDNDSDGFPASVDCNDNDATINPGATEVCDGIDNNCSGVEDDGLTFTTYYADADGDTFGDESDTGTDFCSDPGVGYSTSNDDCDDLEFDVYPGATEICDGLDNNCDGQIDEGFNDCHNGVIIEYCDDKQKKILICHNGKTKCVSINAMDAHLAHGDYLGTCGGNGREGEIDIAEEVPTSYDVVSWPNPTSDSFNVKMVTPNSIDKVTVNAFDMNGRLIHSNTINGNEDYQFGSKLSSGVYFVRLSQANTVKVIKVIKQ